MSQIELIIEELKTLPQAKVDEAARFVHQLRENSYQSRQQAFASAFGCLSGEEADLFQKTIDEGCERIESADEPISN